MSGSIIFVDAQLGDVDALISGLPDDAEIVRIDPSSDGLEQIANSLTGKSGIDAIHIISHGSQGRLYLGNSVLNNESLASYQGQLSAIGSSLTENGDILLYGCNVAQGDSGVQFITSLSQSTGADIAASTELTGAAALGGDWLLEAQVGQIEAIGIAPQEYNGTLFDGAISASITTDLVRAGLSLSMRAYSGAYLGPAKDSDASEAVSSWQGINPNALGGLTDVTFDTSNANVLRCVVGNASATAGLCTIAGKQVLGIGFEGTDFGLEELDIWDDLVDINAHAAKLSGVVQGLMNYAATQGVEQILFAGHSLGGGVAQYYSNLYAANSLVYGVTFGSPGALAANGIADDRLVNFRNTGDAIPVMGEKGLGVFRTLGNISDTTDEWLVNQLSEKLGISDPGGKLMLDSLLKGQIVDGAIPGIVAWLGLEADYVTEKLTFALNRPDYVVDGRDVVIDFIRPTDENLGIAEHTLFDPASETSYESSVQTYRDYSALSGVLQSGYFQIGTSDNDDLQTGQVTKYTEFYGAYDASLGGTGNDQIGRHTLTSNDNEANEMAGGAGDDTYYIDNVYDHIAEAPGTAGGVDTARSRLNNYTLDTNVENLILETNNDWNQVFTNDDINGAGNELNNVITGNNGDNIIDGAGGNDNLIAYQGSDKLYGGAGIDTLIAIDGFDTLQGGTGNDTYDVSRVEYSIGFVPTYDITDIGGIDTLIIRDIPVSSGGALNTFAGLNVRASGNDLIIDLDLPTALLTDGDEGRIVIRNQNDVGAQVESLRIYDAGGNLIGGQALSLVSIWNALQPIKVGGDSGYHQLNIDSVLIVDGTSDPHGLRVSGDPHIYGTAASETYPSTSGSDYFHASLGNDLIDGGVGNDTLVVDLDLSASSGPGVSYTINGSALNTGSSYQTIKDSLDPALHPTTSYSVSLGSLGSTTTTSVENFVASLTGTSSDDLLIYQNGSRYDGGQGTDSFYANWGSSTSSIIWSNDPGTTQYVYASGSTGTPIAISGIERLLITTGSGGDVIANAAATADDTILTWDGSDIVYAGPGNDQLYGQNGNDLLYGGAGNDTLYGGADADSLYGGTGADVLYGGTGNDYYQLILPDAGGTDTILDDAGTDRLRVAALSADYTKTEFHAAGADLTIQFRNSSSSLLGSVVIQNMGVATNQLETLELDARVGTQYNFSLVNAWNWTATHLGDATAPADHTGGPTAYTGSIAATYFYDDAVGDTDDAIVGTNGADVIHALGGNDTIDALGGNDFVDGGSGNDTIAGGAGIDTVIGGAGDDVITQLAGVIDGGAGTDTINVTLINSGAYLNYTRWALSNSVSDIAAGSVQFNSTYADVTTYMASASTAYLQNNDSQSVSSRWVAQLSLSNVENWNVLAGSAFNDLLIVHGAGTTYRGGAQSGGGYDTLYANWSDAATAITWTNDPTQDKVVNGITVKEVERLLITTGNGNDSIDNTYVGNTTYDYIDTGAGNDTIAGGAGIDTVIGGAGDDVITQLAGVIDGGAGTDTINVTLINSGAYLNYTRWALSNSVSDIAAGSVQFNSTYADVTTYMASASTAYLQNNDSQSVSSRWVAQLSLSNVENWNVLAGSAFNDLLIVHGAGTTYRGGAQSGGGYDTLYANWSDAATAITWTNDPTQDKVVNGITVKEVERLLITTGNGNDSIDNTYVGNTTYDYIDTGAGNDTIAGGAGIDTVIGGAGDDVITQLAGVIDGGAGTDTINVTLINSGAYLNYTRWALSNSVSDIAAGSVQFNSTYADVTTYMASASTAYLQNNDSQSVSSRWVAQLSLSNVENWNVLAGSAFNDLLIVHGAGTTYRGGAQSGGGYDTLYANWSDAATAITWTNDPTQDKVVNGITVKEVERLLITTGNGNDSIDNTYVGNTTYDYIDTGAGNDTIAGGAGIDTVIGGAGDDVITQLAGVIDGGAGTDTINVTLINSGAYLNYTRWALSNSVSDIAAGSVQFNSTYADVTTYMASASTAYLQNNDSQSVSSRWVAQLSLSNVENWNVLAGSAFNDLLIVHGAGTTYRGGAQSGGGYDTLYANWSDAATAITWTNDPTQDKVVNGITVKEVERLLITTGNGNDSIDNTYVGNTTYDYIDTGAGNDTIAGGAGIDTVIGGAGDDVITQLAGVIDGGAGTDTINVTLINSGAYLNYTRWALSNSVSDIAAGSVQFNSTYADVTTYMASASTAYLQNNDSQSVSSRWVAQLSLSNVENWNVLAGSAFNDLLIVHGAGTTYRGGAQSGGGYDTLYANWSDAATAITWTNDPTQDKVVNGITVKEVERLLITTGSGNDSIDNTYVGNTTYDYIDTGAGNDTIAGGAGNDTLIGNAGDDRLDGGTGTDSLVGGAGADTYIVDTAADVVVENLDEGIDAIQSSVTLTLVANVENLTLLGTLTINGTGNGLDNVLTGNSAANTLDGGLGGDTLIGGAGNDTYVVNAVTDVVVENLNEGTDLVQSSVSYILSANVENLTLTGAAAIDGSGNELANTLTGNGAANRLDGGAGIDTLVGGAGDDTYVVDVTGDVVTEAASAGADSVLSSASYTLSVNVENLTLTGSSAINGTGNTGNNNLVGNAGANILDGGAGNDTLTGGAGNDVFQFATSGNGSDVTTDFSAGDVIRVAGASFSAAVANGNGATVGLNQVQLAASGGNTVIYIGTNATAGADVSLTLNGTYSAAQFRLSGTDIGLSSPPIVAAPVADQTANVGEAWHFVSGVGTFTDPDPGDALAWSATLSDGSPLPSWLSFNSTTHSFDGTPGEVNIGTYDLKLVASDPGGLSVSDFFTLTVGSSQAWIGTDANETHVGTASADTLDGAGGNDSLSGGAGNDTLSGGFGSDTVEGGAGDDFLNGSMGLDLAVYSGARAGYSITKSGNQFIVTDTNLVNGDDGTDTLMFVERIRFADAEMGLSVEPGMRIGRVEYPGDWIDYYTVADFNADGKTDIWWKTKDGLSGLWTKEGSFSHGQSDGMRDIFRDWSTTDNNGDGRPDAATQHLSGGGSVAWANAEATIAPGLLGQDQGWAMF